MSSERFARLYDKGAERGQSPGFIWRYEVVIRKPYANAIYEQIVTAGLKLLPSLVYGWFDERNVKPLFEADAVGLSSTEPRVTTVEARLAWLRKSVRPAVMKLVQSGYTQETFEALGISIPTSKKADEI
jgi:DNA relaxase NicK